MTSVSPHSHRIGMVRECAELSLDSVCLPVCPLFVYTFVNNFIAALVFLGLKFRICSFTWKSNEKHTDTTLED